MSPSKISNYTILPLIIPAIPSYPKQTTHTLYLRPHTPKIPTADTPRSLFLVNVPIDSTVAHFRAIFTSLIGAGKFEDCIFEGQRKTAATNSSLLKPTTKKRKRREESEEGGENLNLPETWDRELRCSGSTAVVVLVDEKCVEVAIKAIEKLHRKASKSKAKEEEIWPIWGSSIPPSENMLGSHRYATHQKLRFPDQKLLLQNVDLFMTSWNSTEERKNEERRKGRNVVDEDGFVTVTRGGRIGPSRMEDAERKRLELEEREKKKREGMGDFYRFQTREARKERAGELVKLFEGDRERVRRLREGRRGGFRPE